MKGVHHEKESKEKSEKDRTTISKEIRNHCFVKPFRGNNEVNCSLLLKPPYVCNGCENSSRCKQPKMLYDAAIADHEYHHNLSLLWANLKVTKDQVAAINDVVSPLMIHKHHSVNHVYVSHPEVLPFSKSTFYRYIDMGLLDVRNIDLQRKVRFRTKKEYDYSRKKIDHEYRFGRQYHDFQDYMELHPIASIVEMDTVIGTTGENGPSFAGLTQEDCTLLASHINSAPRLSLNNQSPFEAAKGFLGINNIHKLGLQQIPFDDIDLSIRLLRK